MSRHGLLPATASPRQPVRRGRLEASLEDEFRELGELSGGYFHEFQLGDRLNEPELTQWNAWGQRVDHIEVSPLWKAAEVPTAKRGLDGARAVPVAGLTDGIRDMASMLNVTRTWNAVASAWMMRRGLALARDYARRRVQFGAPLAQKPLHVDTLAGLEAEFHGGFLLAFRAAELLGKMEAGTATEEELI